MPYRDQTTGSPRVRQALYLSAGAVLCALVALLVFSVPASASPNSALLQDALPVVTGTVLLQGRSPDCEPSKAITLTATFIDPLDGSARYAQIYTVTADACGVFTVTNLETKAYNVKVKGEHTLSVFRLGVVLTSTQPYIAVPFGPLHEGDIDGDNHVDADDRTLLAESYWAAPGDARFNHLANLNESGYIDALDASLLSQNDGESGPTTEDLEAAELLAGDPTLRVSGVTEMVRGRTTVLTVTMENAAAIGSADVFLTYDPAVLNVVNASGQPATAVTPITSSLDYVVTNTVDSGAGIIAYAAMRTTQSTGGDGALFTVRVQALAATGAGGTDVAFRYDAPGRQVTLLAAGGYDALYGDTPLNIVVLQSYLTRLPTMVRQWSAYMATTTEVEPNDSAAQANGRLRSGVTYSGSFPNTSDPQDYYFFDVAAGHSAEVWLTGIAAGVNADLQLFDHNLASRGYSGNLGNTDEHITPVTLTPGRYYIQVYRRAGTSAQPYNLRVVYE
ncbi:MAG: pre-peptidase C-terminal domain-containing protein [Anaerolineae bacterium]